MADFIDRFNCRSAPDHPPALPRLGEHAPRGVVARPPLLKNMRRHPEVALRPDAPKPRGLAGERPDLGEDLAVV
jgi:hypothetical protein